MTIGVDCGCGRRYEIAEENAGRSFACKECGAQLTVPAAEEDGYDATLAWVQEQRAAGHTRGSLRESLIDHGYSEEQAYDIVDDALGATRVRSRGGRRVSAHAAAGDGGGFGALWYIGGLALFNLLSWMFDWPIWIW